MTHVSVKSSRPSGVCGTPLRSLGAVPGHKHVGKKVMHLLDTFLSQNPAVQDAIVSSLGAVVADLKGTQEKEHERKQAINDHAAHQLRPKLASLLQADLQGDTDITEVVTPLIEAWIKAASDPDVVLGEWLRHGAPAGIERQPDSTGIFPEIKADPTRQFQLAFLRRR